MRVRHPWGAFSSWLRGTGMLSVRGSKVTDLLHHLSLSLRNCLPAGQVALSSLNTTRSCACQGLMPPQLFPHCTDEQSWKSLSNGASLGLFNFLHKCGGWLLDSPLPHNFPLPLCASSIVPECHGLKHEAGLSTGIYERRNKLEPSDWKLLCVVVGS